MKQTDKEQNGSATVGWPKLSVVIPVFNERPTIEQILLRVLAVPYEKEIIIVDDGSTDGTRQFLEQVASAESASKAAMPSAAGLSVREHNIRIILLDSNHGKGAALRRGFREARGEIVIVQDADLEYDPQEHTLLIDPIERGVADAVYGSRFLHRSHRPLYYWYYVGNRILTASLNLLTGLNLSDVWTCYKAFRREVLTKLILREDRFGFEPEVTAQLAKKRFRIHEVPISYHGRTHAEGKKITWKDGVKAIWYVLRYGLLTR